MAHNILQKILARKAQEVALAKQQCAQADLLKQLVNLPPTRDFIAALQQKQPAIIAEIKRASPSRGIIREDFDCQTIAEQYQQAGAAALSVLTDRDFFQGDDHYLALVKQVVALPVLRKEFIIDPYQIYQSRLFGADAILLIAAALTPAQLQSFCDIAQSLQLAVLVEVHNADELATALTLPTPLIGINNRDLTTFITNLETTVHLSQAIPADKFIISESGIKTADDLRQLQRHGVKGFLIGESLMRHADPGQGLTALLSSKR